MTSLAKFNAMRELLAATQRDLQLVDLALADLSKGRIPVSPADDVSTEHRATWLGAVDVFDGNDGINMGAFDDAGSYGFNNVKTGVIRNQEDAAFVCTNILVAIARGAATTTPFSFGFEENENFEQIAGTPAIALLPMIRLTDGSSGRSLVEGNNAQIAGGAGQGMGGGLESGFIPASALGSFRYGLGANYKDSLFSEFTLPRKATVKVEVVNAGVLNDAPSSALGRVCVTLLGYKVYGA